MLKHSTPSVAENDEWGKAPNDEAADGGVENLTMTEVEIFDELESMQQRLTTLQIIIGSMVGLLHAKGLLQGDLSDEIKAMSESARKLAPTLAQSEWDAAWSLVSGFATISAMQNEDLVVRLEI
jgi:hypothetical protein